MEVLYSCCAGLDVHKKKVTACVFLSQEGKRPSKQVRTFSTMLDDLQQLSSWLSAQGVTHVAMESTGVYWRPIWNVLEGDFTLLLANAHHIKTVPGRKTDVKDCEWIAELLRHGLLKGSFVPAQGQRDLRELTRYRTSLLQEKSAEVNRLQKTLEGANIKLAAVATDVMGVSGREILAALVAGTTDPAILAELARGKLRDKQGELQRALAGRFREHHRFLMAQQLAHIDDLDQLIAELDREIAERLRPFEEVISRLDAIPGIGRRIAEILIAEIGVDMSRFPTSGHLASWAGMCPGNNESAGKRHSGKTRKGNAYLRVVLTEAAQAAAHKKDSYLAAQFHRLAARRGRKRAALAVGHSILIIAYHLLAHTDRTYQDLGHTYFDRRDSEAIERRLVKRLQQLGNRVTLEKVGVPQPPAPASNLEAA